MIDPGAVAEGVRNFNLAIAPQPSDIEDMPVKPSVCLFGKFAVLRKNFVFHAIPHDLAAPSRAEKASILVLKQGPVMAAEPISRNVDNACPSSAANCSVWSIVFIIYPFACGVSARRGVA